MDYAPLFDAMHGARWLLSARPATLAVGSNASVNVLILPAKVAGGKQNLLIPIMLAAPTETMVQLTLNLGPASLKALGRTASPPHSVTLSLLSPGHGATPKALGPAKAGAGGEWTGEIPLVRGCAMVIALLS
eukprot:COSAG05_NODE_2255_length_3333_cov_2.791899_2_plen_132_part_00